MTARKYYQALLRSQRKYVPTLDESRRDYLESQRALMPGAFHRPTF